MLRPPEHEAVTTSAVAPSVDATEPGAGRMVRVRRRWSQAEKRRLVALTREPGVSVAEVARRYGLNDNLLFNWRKQLGRLALLAAPSSAAALDFAVVDVVAEATRPARGSGAGLIEIELAGGTRVRVDAEVSQVALVRVLSALKAAS